jgi:predicted GIY-YIG superfamily endonuclease
MKHYLYLVTTEDDKTKIGISNNAEKRFKALQASNPHKLTLYILIEYPSEEIARKVETALHRYFKPRSIHYEWFDVPARQIHRLIKLASEMGEFAIVSNVTKIKVIKTERRTYVRESVHEHLTSNPDDVNLAVRELAQRLNLSVGLVSEERNNWIQENNRK